MSSDEIDPVFVSWEEQVICQERGNRVIHFYLRHVSGDSVLAVVGTERSVRHMMYVVPQQFLQAYGSINVTYKWRARREVVDWLNHLVLKNQSRRAGNFCLILMCFDDLFVKNYCLWIHVYVLNCVIF